jgi:hypothetical protein
VAEPHVKKTSLWSQLFEAFTKQSSGYAYPDAKTFSETALIPLADVMTLYERDPTCKASVDLLAASSVGMGFYTTANEKYDKAKDAKRVVDDFNETVNLDELLNNMARVLIACGNDFWLKLSPEKLSDIRRMPIDAVKKIEQNYVQNSGLKLPYKVEGFKLRNTYGGQTLKSEAVIHWRINCVGSDGFGIGILQVLLHTLTINSDKRPAYAWMKSKIEKIMPKIFEKYAGPDVLAHLPNASNETIKKFEKAIKERPEEGSWLFYTGKQEARVFPITIDPRTSFQPYIDHIVNQFYLGCETPLPRLFSTPGFTEASANAALELQSMLIKPIQRYIKRQVERDIFVTVLKQAGFEPEEAGIRLNWGSPETPEVIAADLIHAAELGLIRSEEFRKNAVKFGWELWEATQQQSNASQEAKK